MLSECCREYLVDANIAFGALLFILQLIYLLYSDRSWKPIKLLYALGIGAYWTGVYLFICYAPESQWKTPGFSDGFIRGGVTLTLIILNVGAIYRLLYSILYRHRMNNDNA